MVNWQDPVTIITEFGAFCDSLYAALSLFDVFANFFGNKNLQNLDRRFRQTHPRRRWNIYVRPAFRSFLCKLFRQIF